jgi:hypothetical protein
MTLRYGPGQEVKSLTVANFVNEMNPALASNHLCSRKYTANPQPDLGDKNAFW